MKKILSYTMHCLLLLFLATGIMNLSSCKKDEAGSPSISNLRNYAPSPNDTICETVASGQWVVVEGENLSGVTQVYFGGIPATVNTTYFSDTYIVIQIPAIPFQSVPADRLNELTIVSESGVVTFQVNITGAPIISKVRNNAASPNDTILKSVVPGQQINIIGYNLENATSILFQGVAADLTNVVYTDSSALIQVPIELSGGDASLANMISYTTRIGAGTYSIKIIGPPIITGVSYEIPHEGDSVYIYGNNFISVLDFSFAGTQITTYQVFSDTVIGFKAPSLASAGGPVVIETNAGTYTTAYNVNNIDFINGGGVGIIGNMEWGDYFGWPWWGGNVTLTSSDPNSGWPSYNADFGVGLGMYLQLKSNILDGGTGDDGNAVRMNDAKAGWVPAENLNDPGTSWALKFEFNVAKPWNGGTLCIKTDKSNYIARYEPWQIDASNTAPYTTKGWQTVTIPLSAFRLTDGTAITNVSDLLDPSSGNGNLLVYIHNYSTAATETSFDAAFDNFRIVKR